MALTAADVVNRALEIAGTQTRITGTAPSFDSTTVGLAAGVLYRPAVEMLLRQINPDFARTAASLSTQSNATLLALTKWTNEYTYPATSLRLRQILPAPGSYDAHDKPQVTAAVMFDPLSSGGPARVVVANISSAIAMFTTSAAGVGGEAMWDSSFAEAVVRRLSSPLAMAVEGRPDYARELLEESARFAQMAELTEEM